MKPFAKMKSALPEPSGFAAARLLDFSLIQSGAFAADAFGAGGVFQRFFRAAAILFDRAARSMALSVFFTPLAIRPRACAALFNFTSAEEVADRFLAFFLGAAARVAIGVRQHAGHPDRVPAGEEFHRRQGDAAMRVGMVCRVLLGLVCYFGFERGFRVHAWTVNRFIVPCKKNVKVFLRREIRAGGGGGSETSCPNPREKSNSVLNEQEPQ